MMIMMMVMESGVLLLHDDDDGSNNDSGICREFNSDSITFNDNDFSKSQALLAIKETTQQPNTYSNSVNTSDW